MGITLLDLLELVGVGALAFSGALGAAVRRLDIAVFVVAAVVVGLVGGSLRDLLIGQPLFWLERPMFLAVCVAGGALAWGIGQRPERASALAWLDAVGLAAVAAVTVERAAIVGVTPLPAAAIGVFAGVAGGLARDALAGERPLMLGREIYLAAVVGGVMAEVVLRLGHVDGGSAALAGAGVTLAFRAGALKRGWRLPIAGGGD